jgi:hypothetical protein
LLGKLSLFVSTASKNVCLSKAKFSFLINGSELLRTCFYFLRLFLSFL